MDAERADGVSIATARRRRQALRAAAGAAAFAALGAAALLAMPKPLTLVPSASPGSGAVRLYYEAAFPAPGDEPLQRPVSVAVLRGRVVVADSIAGVVRVYDEHGVPESVVGSGALAAPTYVACDPSSGRVYVTDRKLDGLFAFDLGSTEVSRIEPRWPVASRAATGSAEATSWAPLGVAVGADGSVWVTDVSARHRVLELDPRGRVVREVGGPGSDSPVVVALDYPNRVAFVGSEMWVSDSNHGRVVVFERSGGYVKALNLRGLIRGLAAVPGPTGDATAVAGVDASGNQIVLWDTGGAELGRFGEPGTTAGRLQFPNDVAVSADGSRLFVADTGNRRIQIWRIEWEHGGVSPEGAAGVDAANRAPYVAAAVASLAAALALAVGAVSLWRLQEATVTEPTDIGRSMLE